MPHDPEIVGQTVLHKEGFGQHDQIMVEKYVAPANDNGGIDTDHFKLKDFELAKTMSTWLMREYPGYPWCCQSDLRQGVVMFSLPVLMGTDEWYVINLSTTDDICVALAKGGGEVLERYRLRRGRMSVDEYLDARAKHSRLVLPFRKIPT